MGFADRWWGQLLPRMAPFLYERGGPIIMMQVGIE
jgi:Glycosyl hydrolases family 35